MLLSEKVWDVARPVVDAIKQHPFNLELAQGSLALDKFAYYLEQDTVYLRDFARGQAMIAARAPLEYVRCFLQYADYTFVVEQEIVHHFFKETFGFQDTGLITPATLAYTSHLLKICAVEPVEVAIAAVLPCFWVYREVGLAIAASAAKENPYQRWIETYTSKEFASTVDEVIDIFDNVAQKTTEAIRHKMIDAFYNSTVLEWHFWNDAWHKTSVDGFLAISSGA